MWRRACLRTAALARAALNHRSVYRSRPAVAAAAHAHARAPRRRHWFTSARLAQEQPPKAVLFDIGGVVVGSPFPAIAAFERNNGLEDGFVNRVIKNFGDTGAPRALYFLRQGPCSSSERCAGAFAKLERGEVDVEEFYEMFAEECEMMGAKDTNVAELFAGIHDSLKPNQV